MALNWSNCTAYNGTVPTFNCVPYVFSLFVQGLLAFVGAISIMFIIFSGIRLILARGDPKALETAHKTFFFALVGIIFILLSFLIINLIGAFTNVPCINQFGFDSCVKLQ